MNIEARTQLTRARAALIIDQPFFGTLALRLKFVEDESIPTLAVDGKSMWYNPKFVLSLDIPVLKAAVAHEVGHCVFDHCTRLQGRNPKKWNHAGDYVINDMLKEAKFTIGANWLYNAGFKGMSSDHIYSLLPDNPEGEALDEIRSSTGASGAPQDASEQEVTRVEWQIATMQAAAVAKAAGKLPGAMERFVEDMTQPKVDWRQQLRNMITEKARDDYSWSHPNRKMLAYGFILPGLYSENFGTMAVVTDDSGSIDKPTFDAFASEICGIRDSVMPANTIHMSCDARVNHYQAYEREELFVMKSKGGGGTDFRPPFHKLEEESIVPKVLIYLTDGYGPFPDTPPEYPVIWVMTTDVKPPFGDCVRIEI